MIENTFIIYSGHQKGPKRPQKGQTFAFLGLWPYGTPYLMKRGGTRLERHIGHPGWSVWLICQTLNVPNVALRGPKRGKNRLKIALWPHKSAHRAYFGLEGVKQGWNTKEDIQTDQFWPFADPNVALREQKSGTNRLKIAFWPHKSAQRAYFWLEGLEWGWNTNEDIPTVWAINRPWLSQMWPYGGQKGAKIGWK